MMNLSVRLMRLSEVGLIVDYFHEASPEHLETMGVDPSRLPPRDIWLERLNANLAHPSAERETLQTLWLGNGAPLGFSTADKIVSGERANMHLHIFAADDRNRGCGAACVRLTADLYFDMLELKRLFCEPNAFNVAPNRTLQAAGFK